ncbi:hypothetical protein BH23GEM6_BH23GEM6_08480 [soil metagenome]
MANEKRRSDQSDPPHVQKLREVRGALFRLHKALVDAERAGLERDTGPMTSGVFLQALLQDPDLAWLRPFSGLIVEIDEALAGSEQIAPGDTATFVRLVEDLVAPAEAGADVRSASRYGDSSRRDPDVLLTHVELMSRIEDSRSRDDEIA